MGKVQATIEFRGDPDPSGLITTMVRLILDGMIWIPPNIFEKCRDRFEKLFLVAFSGEMVMSLSFLDDIPGKRSLGQEGIGSNSFPLDFNGIEERDGSLDFVCLFFLVAAFYRQCSDFFWV